MHAIDYSIFPEKTTKEKLYAHSTEYAFYNVDRLENPSGAYHGNWKLHKTIMKDYDDAVRFLDQQGTYRDGAVLFKKPAQESKKMIEIKSRIKRLETQKTEYIERHHVSDRKSALIGCSNCGSKISREHLRSDFCPVCKADLRPDTVVARLASFSEKQNELANRLKEEERKQAKSKPVLQWLVKTEVHC